MLEKADFDYVRRQNRFLVLASLRREGPLARIELVRSTGLSTATITSITSDLLGEGLIEILDEVGEAAARNRPGRPMTKLALSPAAATALGIEISVDLVRLALVSYDGRVIAIEQSTASTFAADQHRFGRDLADSAAAFLAKQGVRPQQLARIAVSVQGIADTSRGTIAWSPALNGRDIAIRRPLEDRLGVPTTIANDANLMAQALIAQAPASFTGTAAVVFVGRGVGMGLILNGEVYSGPTGAAAEFGHMNHIPGGPVCRCGRRGCVEAYAADYGIHRRAAGLAPHTPPLQAAIEPARMAEIATLARRGEADAVAAFREAGLALGYGLARAIALLDIQRILLLGPGTRAAELLSPAIDEGLDLGLSTGLQRRIEIEPTSSGHDLMIDGLIVSLMHDLDREVMTLSRPVIERPVDAL